MSLYSGLPLVVIVSNVEAWCIMEAPW